MDKAPAYGAGDSGFESQYGLFFCVVARFLCLASFCVLCWCCFGQLLVLCVILSCVLCVLNKIKSNRRALKHQWKGDLHRTLAGGALFSVCKVYMRECLTTFVFTLGCGNRLYIEVIRHMVSSILMKIWSGKTKNSLSVRSCTVNSFRLVSHTYPFCM